MPGQVPGDGALPGAGWPVDGDNDLLPGSVGRTQESFVRTHPRLLVPCFGRAVKPYRLLLPALALAVNAGVRPPREALASVRESLRGAAPREVRPADPDFSAIADPFPLRLFHVEPEDF